MKKQKKIPVPWAMIESATALQNHQTSNKNKEVNRK